MTKHSSVVIDIIHKKIIKRINLDEKYYLVDEWVFIQLLDDNGDFLIEVVDGFDGDVKVRDKKVYEVYQGNSGDVVDIKLGKSFDLKSKEISTKIVILATDDSFLLKKESNIKDLSVIHEISLKEKKDKITQTLISLALTVTVLLLCFVNINQFFSHTKPQVHKIKVSDKFLNFDGVDEFLYAKMHSDADDSFAEKEIKAVPPQIQIKKVLRKKKYVKDSRLVREEISNVFKFHLSKSQEGDLHSIEKIGDVLKNNKKFLRKLASDKLLNSHLLEWKNTLRKTYENLVSNPDSKKPEYHRILIKFRIFLPHSLGSKLHRYEELIQDRIDAIMIASDIDTFSSEKRLVTLSKLLPKNSKLYKEIIFEINELSKVHDIELFIEDE